MSLVYIDERCYADVYTFTIGLLLLEFCTTLLNMNQHPLIEAIARFTVVPDDEAEMILNSFQSKKIKRNEIVLCAGDVAHEVFFIEKGSLCQFYVDEQGNERICNFCFENDFITDLESFSQQVGSSSSIKALEATQAYVIRCIQLVELLEQSLAISNFFRVAVENVATKSIRRTKSLLSYSPEKQFLELLETKSDIFQRVSQRLIAQYLGIAPESLSRIRKRMYIQSKS